MENYQVCLGKTLYEEHLNDSSNSIWKKFFNGQNKTYNAHLHWSIERCKIKPQWDTTTYPL